MTSPDSGAPRPGRVAGVALLGLSVVALVLGLVTALGGAESDNAAERPPDPPATTSSTSSSSTKPPSKTSTTSSGPRPPASTTERPTSTPGTTGTPGATVPPDGNGEPAKTVPVRVLNNSKIRGLAATAASDLKAGGWQVTEVGNYPYTNLPETTVYFRPGTDEEAAARTIAADFGIEVAPRIDTLHQYPPGVIVIVTSDYADADGGKNEN